MTFFEFITQSSLATAAIAAFVVLTALWMLISAINSRLYICEPNEVLVFSGRERQLPDGSTVGFRVIRGGRAFKWPIVEKVDRMNLSVISVPMAVRGAYSEGGIPLDVHAVANIKIAAHPAIIGNAIERFLGHSREEIARVAKETLEGHLRGVLATMTPEEVNEDRLKFAQVLLEEASEDLRKLGLQLDTLKIQQVSDERNYLDSIGRKRIAEIVRAAEVAESDAVRAAEEAEAEARARAGVAQKQAETSIQRRTNELRRVVATLDAEARAVEEEVEQAALTARAVAERELQALRGQLEKLRLEADVTIPATMERRVKELIAAGEAAGIAEQGRANAEALAEIATAWRECGADPMSMLVLQKLDGIVEKSVAVTTHAAAQSGARVMDAGDGDALRGYLSTWPQTAHSLLREISSSVGVDLDAAMRPAPAPVHSPPQTALRVEQG